MKKIVLLLHLICLTGLLKAQDIFVAKGKIEFERKLNFHKSMEALSDDDNDKTWFEMIKKSTPPVITNYFDLYFNDDQTLYKPGREAPQAQKVPEWALGPSSDNTVFTDLKKEQTISLKNVYENTFLITDSLRKIDWRITADKRDIAGFECRKAVGKIMDSVYVIAFYTDQIVTNGGPESFSGLPGMILGIAIPRINTTWFATKLELVEVKPEDIAAPKKGKKVNNKELLIQLKDVMKNWGKYGQRNIWNIMI